MDGQGQDKGSPPIGRRTRPRTAVFEGKGGAGEIAVRRNGRAPAEKKRAETAGLFSPGISDISRRNPPVGCGSLATTATSGSKRRILLPAVLHAVPEPQTEGSGNGKMRLPQTPAGISAPVSDKAAVPAVMHLILRMIRNPYLQWQN